MSSPMSTNKPGGTPPSPSTASNAGSALALRVLVGLSEALPRQNGQRPLSPEALEFMAGGLASLPPEALMAAAAKARDTCRFMPTVAELRELAGATTPPKPEDAAMAEALNGLQMAQDWLRAHRDCLRNPETGMYGSTCQVDHGWQKVTPPSCPRLARALPERVQYALRQSGGIHEMWHASMEAGQWQWFRKQFCEAYRLAPFGAMRQLGDGNQAEWPLLEAERLAAGVKEIPQ